jgi:hypothetical protein
MLAGTKRLEAPLQANLFAKTERELKAEKQVEMLKSVDRCYRSEHPSSWWRASKPTMHAVVGDPHVFLTFHPMIFPASSSEISKMSWSIVSHHRGYPSQ